MTDYHKVVTALGGALKCVAHWNEDALPADLAEVVRDARLDITEAQRRVWELMGGKPAITLPLTVGQRVRMRSGATGVVESIGDDGEARATYCLEGHAEDYWWYYTDTGLFADGRDGGENERDIVADDTSEQPDADGWFTHVPVEGATCPEAAAKVNVEIRLRCGDELSARLKGSDWNWGAITDTSREIVAWRFKP